MKQRVTVYLPNKEAVEYITGRHEVRSIYQYGDAGIKITFDDGSSSVYYNMPFELHEVPEEIDKSDVPF